MRRHYIVYCIFTIFLCIYILYACRLLNSKAIYTSKYESVKQYKSLTAVFGTHY